MKWYRTMVRVNDQAIYIDNKAINMQRAITATEEDLREKGITEWEIECSSNMGEEETNNNTTKLIIKQLNK